jgi:hypothetical protein
MHATLHASLHTSASSTPSMPLSAVANVAVVAWPNAAMLAPESLGDPSMPGAGMPQERLARIAARRSFVAMKRSFIDGIAELAGERGDWLRQQVRQALEPADLWLLRGAVLSALKDGGRQHARLQLHQLLDSAFPDSGGALSGPSR